MRLSVSARTKAKRVMRLVNKQGRHRTPVPQNFLEAYVIFFDTQLPSNSLKFYNEIFIDYFIAYSKQGMFS